MNIDLAGSESKLTQEQTSCCCTVEVTTMDQLLKKHSINFIDLLMIDVEGAELLVLHGFPWESVTVGKIFCELHPYAWKDFGYSSKNVSDFFNFRRYRCFDMYFEEYVTFKSDGYIGPTLLLPQNVKNKEGVSEILPHDKVLQSPR